MDRRDIQEDAVRVALRRAFNRDRDMEPSPDLSPRLRERLRDAVKPDEPRGSAPPRWVALAASIALAAGLAGGIVVWRPNSSSTLALDAVADHWNCALNYRLIKRPVPLDEAARSFDKAYAVLLDAPPDTLAISTGEIRVTERHACAFGERRFAHIVMRYRGRVVSLLLTASASSAPLERTSINGFSVRAVPATDHTILLVSDLAQQDLDPLAQAISIPLARQIGRAVLAGVPDKLVTLSPRSAGARLPGFCVRPAL